MSTLVVIDDEYIVIDAVRAMIARAQLDITLVGSANNGIDGLEVIRATKPDIVITDIRMPGMDGLNMLEQAAKDHPVCAYIIISGYREFEYARRAMALNVLDYVEKPILLASIVAALTRADKHLAVLRCLRNIQAMEQEKHIAKAETKNKAVSMVLDYIHSNYDRDIGLSDLAQAADLTPAYLCNLFKECVGMSYIKYLTSVRLDRAKQMLQSGEKAMRVSEKVGYSDYHYFCRVFKKCTGMTPNEYKDHSSLRPLS